MNPCLTPVKMSENMAAACVRIVLFVSTLDHISASAADSKDRFTKIPLDMSIFFSFNFQIEMDTPNVRLGKPTYILVPPVKLGPVRKIMFDSHIAVKVRSTNIQM